MTTSHKPPTSADPKAADHGPYAPATLVCTPSGSEITTLSRVREGEAFTVIRDDYGVPYVSAEGMEDWAKWVATDNEVGAFQYQRRPAACDDGDWLAGFLSKTQEAPETHRHPGDWRDSLYRVWGG